MIKLGGRRLKIIQSGAMQLRMIFRVLEIRTGCHRNGREVGHFIV